MRLTQFTDYALRLLIYAAMHPDRLVTIEEAAVAYEISRSHLMKVANLLTREGFLKAVRGRSGGLTLGQPAKKIILGQVVRATEPDFAMLECFGTADQTCCLSPECHLRGILAGALDVFMAEMDRHTLADLVAHPAGFGLARPAA
ncbi:MAG TPA: Rrf2 family transcriptional regulator [Devosia sp.]|nr:Rrf2 family transcriptional regulator [Devosia sp.]